jgi:hypothetical protein
MFSNSYKTKEGTIISSISGGRAHFPAREPLNSVSYTYTLLPGDNFYTLAANIFSDDSFWWVLDDMNTPKDVFLYETGAVITLPKNIVAGDRNKKRIF